MRRHALSLPCLTLLFAVIAIGGQLEDELLVAVRKSDVAGVKAALAKGANVNFKFRYDRNALSFACDRGNVEIAKMLIDAGA
ncbi:MAG: ankyrin repeat domain-containing protein, partial [Acidobacteria bacterium]|nr:ankyrin repeat domain-containing protein [Acidobacteriota bacterium]